MSQAHAQPEQPAPEGNADDLAGDSPSPEEQTPALDAAQSETSKRDSEAYFAQEAERMMQAQGVHPDQGGRGGSSRLT